MPTLLLGLLFALGLVPAPASAATTTQDAAVATADASVNTILDGSINNTGAVEAQSAEQRGNDVVLDNPTTKQLNAERSTPTLSQQASNLAE